MRYWVQDIFHIGRLQGLIRSLARLGPMAAPCDFDCGACGKVPDPRRPKGLLPATRETTASPPRPAPARSKFDRAVGAARLSRMPRPNRALPALTALYGIPGPSSATVTVWCPPANETVMQISPSSRPWNACFKLLVTSSATISDTDIRVSRLNVTGSARTASWTPGVSLVGIQVHAKRSEIIADRLIHGRGIVQAPVDARHHVRGAPAPHRARPPLRSRLAMTCASATGTTRRTGGCSQPCAAASRNRVFARSRNSDSVMDCEVQRADDV